MPVRLGEARVLEKDAVLVEQRSFRLFSSWAAMLTRLLLSTNLLTPSSYLQQQLSSS